MSFQYEQRRKGHNQDSMWTSYSDLFLGLSVIFLLLYVTASLRQGTDGIRQHLDNKQLSRENEDLKQQLKVYNSLKQNYLETQATNDEQKTYEMLMDKLNLLQEEANDEKTKLEAAANDNAVKEKAINQYQQTIRNIINANLLSKARIKNRDVLITKNEDTIEGQSQEITSQQNQLEQKRQEIEKGENKIADLQANLKTKLQQLKQSYKSQRLTEETYRKRQTALKQETEQKISSLSARNQKAEQDLVALNEQLGQTSAEKSQLEVKLADTTKKYTSDVQRLQSNFEAQKAKDRAEFEQQLAKEKVSGEERARREAKFRAQTEQKAAALEQQIAAVKGDLSRTKADLDKAHENLNARKKLADTIKGKFRANGVRADVDGRTGDVLLSFDGEYFDTGNASLKPGMKRVLERAMPAYAQSLFEDKTVADKIENVEIIGFASPTYNGRYIDPSKLSDKDRSAVNYNMDLSYGRARSIFDHMLAKMQFDHKQRLLPLVKVTGRSFLDKTNREPTSEDDTGFCKKNDCAKKQTVVIRFKLKDQ